MAAFLVDRTQFGILLSILTFFAVNSEIYCNSTERFTSHEDNYHFQSLFSDLLTELHGYETNIHRCMIHSNNSQCFNSQSQLDSQTYFIFPTVSKALESNCFSEDIYTCMHSDTFVNGVLKIVEEDISKTVEDVCCFLAHECQRCEVEDATLSPKPMQVAPKGDCREECINCSKNLGIDDTKSLRRLKILENMTCTNKTFNNFPCTELNIVALNVLSTVFSSSKLLEDAKDMIKHCNPGFFEDPARTLSAMINTPTDDEISNLNTFFSSDLVEIKPTPLQPKVKTRPGKVIGIIVLLIVVVASLLVMGWLIRSRIFNSNHSRTTNFSTVLYSRIDYEHKNLDDYSDDDDDDKGELSMFERV